MTRWTRVESAGLAPFFFPRHQPLYIIQFSGLLLYSAPRPDSERLLGYMIEPYEDVSGSIGGCAPSPWNRLKAEVDSWDSFKGSQRLALLLDHSHLLSCTPPWP